MRPLDEAAAVKREELDSDALKKIKTLEKITRGKASQYFDGMSGLIVVIKLPGTQRLMKDALSDVLKIVRWMEIGSPKEAIFGF